MKKVGLICLHGMGDTAPNYYQALVDNLQQALGDDWQKVSFEPVYYAPILQAPQNRLWQSMLAEPQNNLHAQTLRRFLLFGLGDAGSLENSAGRLNQTYLEVEKLIAQALANIYQDDTPGLKPVVVVAHSLGAQVFSNYLWDSEQGVQLFSIANEVKSSARDSASMNSQLGLKVPSHLLTMGANIPLFIGGLGEAVCFERPHPSFTWENVYDPDDVLGWPLAQLGKSYQAIVQDTPLQVGSILTGWTPLSHNAYWQDKKISKRVSAKLRQYLSL